MSFWGRYFSEQSCNNDNEGMQLVSNSTSTVIEVGELRAPCVVLEQNSTYLQCVPHTLALLYISIRYI